MEKHCQQAGALPQAPTYVPKLFEAHFLALLDILCDKPVSITADEMTDVRDNSILNVLASVKGRPYLIGVVKMETCHHSTFSQAMISSISKQNSISECYFSSFRQCCPLQEGIEVCSLCPNQCIFYTSYTSSTLQQMYFTTTKIFHIHPISL